jgi:hypothetical protein
MPKARQATLYKEASLTTLLAVHGTRDQADNIEEILGMERNPGCRTGGSNAHPALRLAQDRRADPQHTRSILRTNY